jgi:alcohol dehydrogenase class IV
MLSPPFDYSLLMPGQIRFGWGARRHVGSLAATLGRRVFLLSGSRALTERGVIAELVDELDRAGLPVITAMAAAGEPVVGEVDRLTQSWRDAGAGPGDCLLAVGGGSALDLGKAVAALLPQPARLSVRDYLEGVGTGAQLTADPLPLIAMPTTSGTGSEATKNAVISSYEPPFKKSLRSDRMVPRIALVDPELTVSVSPTITAHTGMDAITQCLESYITRKATPIPQALALQGLKLALPALGPVVQDGTLRPEREALAHAALLSGIALANSGLGLAHGVAAALGIQAKVPHGLACAVMLVPALHSNLAVAESPLAELARELLPRTPGSDHGAASALIEHLTALCAELGIPTRLRELGVARDQLPALVPASHGNSLSGNPRAVSDDELRDLLESLW